MKNHYIQATIQLIQKGTDIQEVLTGLQRTMVDKGHMRLYGAVLRGVFRILETKKESLTATVTVAEEAAIAKYTDAIKNALTVLEAGDDYTVKVDPTIIGGVIVKNNNTVVDRSFKTALTNLYRAATR